MNFLTIDDFKSKPTVLEYLSLYTASSAFIITASASVFGNLAMPWMWLSSGLLLLICVSTSVSHQLRTKRALLFYQEWATGLDTDEMYTLQNRLKEQSPELALLKQIQTTSEALDQDKK